MYNHKERSSPETSAGAMPGSGFHAAADGPGEECFEPDHCSDDGDARHDPDLDPCATWRITSMRKKEENSSTKDCIRWPAGPVAPSVTLSGKRKRKVSDTARRHRVKRSDVRESTAGALRDHEAERHRRIEMRAGSPNA